MKCAVVCRSVWSKDVQIDRCIVLPSSVFLLCFYSLHKRKTEDVRTHKQNTVITHTHTTHTHYTHTKERQSSQKKDRGCEDSQTKHSHNTHTHHTYSQHTHKRKTVLTKDRQRMWEKKSFYRGSVFLKTHPLSFFFLLDRLTDIRFNLSNKMWIQSIHLAISNLQIFKTLSLSYRSL